jgi:hypothetical protein
LTTIGYLVGESWNDIHDDGKERWIALDRNVFETIDDARSVDGLDEHAILPVGAPLTPAQIAALKAGEELGDAAPLEVDIELDEDALTAAYRRFIGDEKPTRAVRQRLRPAIAAYLQALDATTESETTP